MMDNLNTEHLNKNPKAKLFTFLVYLENIIIQFVVLVVPDSYVGCLAAELAIIIVNW